MIKTEQLVKRFGDLLAVDNLSLEVGEGEIFGFLGPNGAGKTTTIRILCGLIQPTAGKAWVAGHQVGVDSDKVRQAIGLLTETPGLYEQLSAWDNLIFFAEMYSLPPVEARKRVQETLEWLQLWGRHKEPVATFSKGMKQRLAIGRSLLHRPQVLFLDEPTAGLDAESARLVRDSIIALKNTRRTIFLSTHNMDEAERLCDQIAIFKTKLIQLDTPRNLRRRFGVGARGVQVRLRSAVSAKLLETIQALTFVQHATVLDLPQESGGGFALEVSLADPDNQNPALVKCLVENGAEIQYITEQTATLEEVYLNLTQK